MGHHYLWSFESLKVQVPLNRNPNDDLNHAQTNLGLAMARQVENMLLSQQRKLTNKAEWSVYYHIIAECFFPFFVLVFKIDSTVISFFIFLSFSVYKVQHFSGSERLLWFYRPPAPIKNDIFVTNYKDVLLWKRWMSARVCDSKSVCFCTRDGSNIILKMHLITLAS